MNTAEQSLSFEKSKEALESLLQNDYDTEQKIATLMSSSKYYMNGFDEYNDNVFKDYENYRYHYLFEDGKWYEMHE